MTLELGTAKIDITPEKPIPLAGFAVRKNRPFEAIASRIYARIAFFRNTNDEGNQSSGIIVSADLLWWGSQLTNEIIERLAGRWHLQKDAIMLHGTHSHSGPQTTSNQHPYLGTSDPDYLKVLREKIVAGVHEAYQNLEEVEVYKNTGECKLGVYRRTEVDGKLISQANEQGPVDNEMFVFKFKRAGKPSLKAIFVHYAVHPVISMENLLSAEFPGEAMNMLEQDFGAGTHAFFLQGCCGDINVNFTKDKQFIGGDQNDIIRYAKQLKQAVDMTMQKQEEKLTTIPFTCRTFSLPLQFQPLHPADEVQRMMKSGGTPYKEWASYLLEEKGMDVLHTLQFQTLQLCDGLIFLFMNAEIVVEYGLYIKQKSGGKVVPIPYTNGMTGYIPSAEQIDKGGYESESSIYYFYLPGKLVRETESQVKTKLDEVIGTILC